MSSLMPHERLFVALDTPDAEAARALAARLGGRVGGFKIGLELFSAHGPDLVREMVRSAPVFLDLKLHDIPNTVAGAAAAAARLGVSFITLHAAGGAEMIRRAVEAASEAARSSGLPCPTTLAVTVLTSHDDSDLEAVGMAGPTTAAVARLAALARDAGARGLVCSARELSVVRPIFPGGVLVVPGIRPASGAAVVRDDQSRTATPAVAIVMGADRLVIGRPVTGASDPAGAVSAIAEEIARATAEMPR
jgi:orotidine-5'-phosphate decarboxylase